MAAESSAGDPVGADVRRRAAAHVLVAASTDLGAGELALDDDVEHHLSRVLRLRDGEIVTVADGLGRWRAFRASRGADRRAAIRLEPIGEVLGEERAEPILTIATAIPKGDRADWMVQKATEIGIDRLVLLHAERSVVRLDPERADRQLRRFRRIAEEAARQSRRVWRMEIEGPVDAAEVLPGSVVAEPGGRRLGSRDRRIAIGPEGGWTDDEVALAAGRVDLGPHVLRSETAVLVAGALSVTLAR